MGTTLFIFDPNLSHKLATAKEAARDIFIYSSTANRKSDGTYGAQPSAKAILKPEVKSPSLGLTLSPLLEPMVQTRARACHTVAPAAVRRSCHSGLVFYACRF